MTLRDDSTRINPHHEHCMNIRRMEEISKKQPGDVFVGHDGTLYCLSSQAIEQAGKTLANLKGQDR